VTTMRIDEGLDTGDMLMASTVPIVQEETAVDVMESLAAVGAELMVKTLAHLAAGTATAQKQDHAKATLAPILKREDGAIDFARGAQQIYDRWRGFQPWPGAHTTLRGKKLIVHRMKVEPGLMIPAGEIVADRDLLCVGCGDGVAIKLAEVQMEGKRRMSAAEFLRGFQLRSGERLGG